LTAICPPISSIRRLVMASPAGAAEAPRNALVALREGVEQLVRLDRHAHGGAHGSAARRCGARAVSCCHHHLALLGELDGIAGQVDQIAAGAWSRRQAVGVARRR
jgi:hypothetical protein